MQFICEFFQIVANLRKKIFQRLETNAHVGVVHGSAVFGLVVSRCVEWQGHASELWDPFEWLSTRWK